MIKSTLFKKITIAVLLIVSLSFSLVAEKKNLDNKITKKTTKKENTYLNNFVILESSGNHILDPHLTSHAGDSQILEGLYEGLFSYNPINLDPVPAIASEYKISRDKLRWTFTIKSEAKFSDGSAITANDVKNSWLKLLGTKGAPYSSLLDIIEGAAEYRNGTGSADDVGIYSPEDLVLVVRLKKPANYLPKLLCHTAFSVISSKNNVYSGAFVLSETSDSSVVLTKNPYYWDSDKVEMEKISFLNSDNADDNSYFFNTGLVDWVSCSANYTKIINNKSIVSNALFGTTFLFFRNSEKSGNQKKYWDIKEFRQAILEATPWEQLHKDYYFPAETFVYPLVGYPVIQGYSYKDSIEATRLMKIAKEKMGLNKDDVIELKMEVPKFSFSDEDLKALEQSWAQIGVKLSVKEASPYTYYDNIPNSDADICSYSWIGDFADPLAFLELFRSDSSLNDSGWKNKEYDNLLDLAAAAANDADRYKYLGQAESLLLDECMVLPIQHQMSINLINLDEVGGWSVNAFDLHPLKYLRKKKVSTKIPNII